MQWISIWLLALLIASPTFAATIRVGVGPSADFNTIQAAVDAAKSGDVINVDTANYNEQVTVNGKNITIKATGAGDMLSPLPAITPNNLVPNAQTADGREISALLVVENAWVEIRNIRITGGRITTTKRRAADTFVGIAMFGQNAGLDVQEIFGRTNRGSGNLR